MNTKIYNSLLLNDYLTSKISNLENKSDICNVLYDDLEYKKLFITKFTYLFYVFDEILSYDDFIKSNGLHILEKNDMLNICSDNLINNKIYITSEKDININELSNLINTISKKKCFIILLPLISKYDNINLSNKIFKNYFFLKEENIKSKKIMKDLFNLEINFKFKDLNKSNLNSEVYSKFNDIISFRSNKLNIHNLKNIELNKDIYIICSGKSMDYYNLNFFDDKVTICVNQTYKKFKANYIIIKERNLLKKICEENINNNTKIICSKFSEGWINNDCNIIDNDHEYYYFDHDNNHTRYIDIERNINSYNKLIVGWSTVVSAIHLGYYLGAKNIYLAGLDMKIIDNQLNYLGYAETKDKTCPNHDLDDYKKFIVNHALNLQTLAVRNSFKKYLNICSISPLLGEDYELNLINS